MSRRTTIPASILVSLILLLVAALSASIMESGTASPDEFTIRYCVHDINPPNSDETYLFIYSNGTAEFTWFVNGTYGNWTQKWSGALSSELVSEALQTMNSEMSLVSSYEDDGWPGSNHTERACIEIYGIPRMVSFHGRSMMGVMPGSYAILNNIAQAVCSNKSDIPDAALSITVTKPDEDDQFAMISVNFTNNGDVELSDSALCNVSWPTFVVSKNGTTVGDLQRNTFPTCLMTFPPQSSTDFGPWSFNCSTLPADEYVIMSHVVIWDWTSGNLSSNSTFVPDVDELDEKPGQALDETLILAVAGAAVATVIVAVILSRKRSKGSTL